MYVIGTAGHVDHGKSTLVQALTGIDPDRLQEEKERGMTIELGFAWLELPGGLEVSIVDVPGHERFIKNMLMGVGGVELALLVVAADEGVMPQTREHLAILDLLDIGRGVVAMTKRDLVETEWLELVEAEVAELLEGTTLEGAPIVPVSAVTRDGLPELLAALAAGLSGLSEMQDLGRPRLPVDRSFTIAGFGTVVTGTLADGRFRTGQSVEILPAGTRARIRGLQTHKKTEDEALPGTRVAVNLSGVSYEEISRGDVLALPGWLYPSEAVDVSLKVIAGSPRPVKHNAAVAFFTGSSETPARVRLLDKAELAPGESGWAQIKMEQPAAVVKGDYFVIRDTVTTLGGGRVADLQAPRHRRFHAPTIERLRTLSEGTGESMLLGALTRAEPADAAALARAANLSEKAAADQLIALVAQGQAVELDGGGGNVYYSSTGWAALSSKARDHIGEYHGQYPLRPGMPKEELRSRLGLTQIAFLAVLERLSTETALEADEAVARLPGYEASLSAEQRREIDAYLAALGSSPYSPPTDGAIDLELVNALVDQERVVRTMDDVVFLKSAYDEMEARVIEHARQEGPITISAVREMFGTSRKYTLALLEHMDRQQITRRVGDDRVLR
jgi:selenocysteine-specific elongation factor